MELTPDILIVFAVLVAAVVLFITELLRVDVVAILMVMALVMMFKMSWSAFLAPAYAVLQGLFLGSISAYLNEVYPGLPMQAVALTMLVAPLTSPRFDFTPRDLIIVLTWAHPKACAG